MLHLIQTDHEFDCPVKQWGHYTDIRAVVAICSLFIFHLNCVPPFTFAAINPVTKNRKHQKAVNKKSTSLGKPSQLRIISGEWGSRKIEFNAWDGLRPTPDRVRETLFNWLSFDIEGRHCLDLFSGTGILGLEALSRGAASATFIDSSAESCKQLKQNLSKLRVDKTHEIIQTDVMMWLKNPGKPFDLIFADPPFRQSLIRPLGDLLEQNGWLTDKALIYLEYEADLPTPIFPANWTMLKEKKAGQVISTLFSRSNTFC